MEGLPTMPFYNEASAKAALKYHRDKLFQVKFALNKKLDEDIIVWLESQENRQGYLKQLIRDDMTRKGFKMPADE